MLRSASLQSLQQRCMEQLGVIAPRQATLIFNKVSVHVAFYLPSAGAWAWQRQVSVDSHTLTLLHWKLPVLPAMAAYVLPAAASVGIIPAAPSLGDQLLAAPYTLGQSVPAAAQYPQALHTSKVSAASWLLLPYWLGLQPSAGALSASQQIHASFLSLDHFKASLCLPGNKLPSCPPVMQSTRSMLEAAKTFVKVIKSVQQIFISVYTYTS